MLASVLGLGLAYRGLAALALPVVFDEACVMAYGLSRAFGGARAFLFEVPIAVSNGITPLWFWAQSVSAALLGETTKAGLRALPILLGLVAVWLTGRESGARGGRGAAVVGGLLAAVFGPYLFANARGEYSESLLVVLVLLLLSDLRRAGGALPSFRCAFWPALALFTYLGKGLMVWGAFAVYVALLVALRAGFGSWPRREVLHAAGLVALPLVPALVWLLAAQAVLFPPGAVLVTDLGPVDGVWANLRRLTAGYGSEAQTFMVGSGSDALYVYTDFDVWPSLALLAVPALGIVARLALDLVQAIPRRDVKAAAGALAPLCLVLVPAGLLVTKGALDVRFHLLFWPVLLVYCALAIDAWLVLLEKRRLGPFLLAGLATWAYVAWTQRGSAPVTRLGWAAAGAGVALLSLAYARRGVPGPRMAVAPAALVMLWTSVVLGPVDWGRRWAWEPSPTPTDVPRAVATFPSVDLQLVRCALGRDGVSKARPFLLRALERNAADRQTVLEVGEALIAGEPDDARLVLAPLGEWSRRHPDDAEARVLLERALLAAARP